MRPALLVLCLLFAVPALPAQEPPAEQQEARSGFFSGYVAELSNDRVTVSRSALGKSERRTFSILPETKVEGKLAQGARVTVRFRTSDAGDVAVHIIVRSAPNGKG